MLFKTSLATVTAGLLLLTMSHVDAEYAPVETWLMEIQKRGLRPINAASHPLESHLRPSLPDVPYYLMSMAAIQNIADDL